MPQPPDLEFRLGARTGQECVVRRVQRAGEHEILPHQQPELVAQVVEILALVDAAAPDPHHVHVGLGRAAQVPLVVGAGQPGDETVRGNPVGALGEDRPAVDDKLERFAPRVGVAVQGDRAQSDPALPPADRARRRAG